MLHDIRGAKKINPREIQQAVSRSPTSTVSDSVSRALFPPINEIAAHFFVANYVYDKPPLSEAYQLWLTDIYLEASTNHTLRAAIEAVGLAAISNISYAPQVAVRSRYQYGRALAILKESLGDPAEAITDITLLTIILLGLFDLVSPDRWSEIGRPPRSWTVHLQGATILLQLRGPEQFDHERGGQFYILLRSQLPRMPTAGCSCSFGISQALSSIRHDFRTNLIATSVRELDQMPP